MRASEKSCEVHAPEKYRWGVWWTDGERSGWVTREEGDGPARYTEEEARAEAIRFRRVAIWQEAGFTYEVREHDIGKEVEKKAREIAANTAREGGRDDRSSRG